ncbi:G2/mitotic-specific cyclin-4 [Venturia nashicola]|uniref:G2/mitotic-specific cyclin-4 n=1 Tax=Venturia nashicola TaxID=86259 RepID=A0A4Z1NUC3_9PEZI|nr:G2/mitotic-specific cyclin-4 [Venturia nashicola]
MSLFAQLRKGCHLGPISNLPLEIRQIIFGYTISPFKRPEDVGLGYIADPFITQDFLALCKDFNQSITILQSYTEENTGAGWLTSVREKWRREWETCMSEMLEEDKEVWYKWYYLGVSGDRPGWSLYKHFKMIVEQMRIGLAYSAMRTPEMCAATELYEMRTGEVYMHQSYVNDPSRFRDEAVLKALDSVR